MCWGDNMNVELTTMVMIQNPATGEVLVQNRTGKWPGYSFPGGKVDPGESFSDCAIREIKEETGLIVSDLVSRGVVHWYNKDTSDRYVVFLYKTSTYRGELIAEFDKGQHFWQSWDELMSLPKEKFSNAKLRYIELYFGQEFNEVFITYSGDEYAIVYS